MSKANGYNQVAIGEICRLVNGRAFKPSDWGSEGLPIIRIQNLNDHSNPFNYYSGEYDPRHEVNSGDLLFSWSGTPGTSFGAFFWNRGKGVLNQHIFNVITDEKRIDKVYFRYALNNRLDHIIAQSHGGVGLKHITKGKLEEVKVPLPPLGEQKRIAAVLDAAEALRAKRSKCLQLLEHLKLSTFNELFGMPSSKDSKWKLLPIGELLESASYGTSEKADLQGKIPVLRMNNLTYSGDINLDDLKYLDLDPSESERYMVRDGDILFNRTNSVDLVGKTAVYREAMPVAYAGYLIRLRTLPQHSAEYLSGVLNSPWGKKTLRSMCKSIIGMANINATEIQNLVIPVPPKKLQFHFADAVFAIQKHKNILVTQTNEMNRLFASLQHRAFRGDL